MLSVAVQLLHFGTEVAELTALQLLQPAATSLVPHTPPSQALLPACLLPHREGRAEARTVVACLNSTFNRAVTHNHVDP